MFLTKILDGVDVNVENRHSCLALGISINSIIHQERILVDNGASSQPINQEFLIRLHHMDNLNMTALNDIHLFRISINLVKE